MGISRRSFMMMGAAAAVVPSVRGAEKAEARTRVALGGPLGKEGSALLKKTKFTPLEIAVGAETPFKAIHCSDTHLNLMDVSDLIGAKVEQDLAMYEGRRVQHNPIAPFAACVLKARLLKAPLLHTGDVWDYHSSGNYAVAKDAFDAAGDAFYAMGNHEIKGHWAKIPGLSVPETRAEMAPYLPNDSRYAARVIHGVQFVSFDNTASGFDLADEQFAFVKRAFEKGLPTVLMMHLPFHTPELEREILEGSGPFKEKYDERRAKGKMKAPPAKKDLPGLVYGLRPKERKLKDYVLAQPNLKAVLCGHLHIEAQYRLTDTVTQYVAGAGMKGMAYEISFA